jgi:glycerol-3-phosphate dehydrogenase (NAD(P)+)
MTSVTVLGAGAWGIGLALTALRGGNQTTLWSPFPDEIAQLQQHKEHQRALPGVRIPDEILLSTDLGQAAQANILLMVTPAQSIRAVSQSLKPLLSEASYLVLCAKGIEQETGLLLSQVVGQELPHLSLSVLAGPNFAKEVAMNEPAAALLGTPLGDQGAWLASSLSHERFRVFVSADVQGIELSSAVKNVLAVAAGMVTGLGLGENARAAVITYGMTELQKILDAEGGDPETLLSLAGLGDIVLTCTSPTSRNMKFGLEYAQKKVALPQGPLQGPLTEGVYTAKALMLVAQRHNLRFPLFETIYRILYEEKPCDEEMLAFLQKPYE